MELCQTIHTIKFEEEESPFVHNNFQKTVRLAPPSRSNPSLLSFPFLLSAH